MHLGMASYVIITPAHNEEGFIEKTLNSVVAQSVLPLKWVIVNDASDDRTGEIVERYARHHRFMQLLQVTRPAGRDFGNKARAFNLGLETVRHLSYDYIGNLDADISLPRDYYEAILSEFDRESKLGISGGMISSFVEGQFISQDVALDSVAGAVQLFRRECFEQTGGYMALPQGGIDTAAEIIARKNGWIVQTRPELRVLEYRRTGTATARPLTARIREGKRLHALGYSFLFFFLRCVYRSMERPKLIGSVAAFYGYLISVLRRQPMVLPPDVVKYLRTEQNMKILQMLRRYGFPQR